MDIDKKDEFERELFLRWQVAGHEVIPERVTFRHKTYKKDFPKGTKVCVEGVPIYNYDKPVLVEDILPERADLCLDADANVVSQEEFERRYKAWLSWFPFVEGSDPTCEPIQGVLKYLKDVPDSFSESPGMIEVNFNARIPAPEKTHTYNPVTDELIPIQKNQEQMTAVLADMTEVLSKLKRGPGRPPKEAA